MVDAPQLAVESRDQVVRLPVGAVGNQVKAANNLQLLGVIAAKGVIVLPRVVLDELLDRADAVRPLADQGEGNQAPAQDFAEQVGSTLPLVQSAVGKIPQRGFAVPRLVNAQRFLAIQGNVDDECVVGTQSRQLAGEDFATAQNVLDYCVSDQAAMSGVGSCPLPVSQLPGPCGRWPWGRHVRPD